MVFVFADDSKAVVLLHTDIDERLTNGAAYVLPVTAAETQVAPS